jgi:hypothetical protein
MLPVNSLPTLSVIALQPFLRGVRARRACSSLDEAPQILRAWSNEPGKFKKIMITLD